MEILFIFTVVAIAVLLYQPLQNWYERISVKRHYRIFQQHRSYYRSVIISHMRYFRNLDSEEQERFLFRTYLFKKAKRFHYIEVSPSADMPILISAVAVQLSFGLEKFRLDYFRDIFVLKDDYHYGFYSRPFQGHVDHSGIYLSWDNFLKGIHGEMVNCNVGLHEMAHALAYVNFITQTEEDKHFKKEFKNFSKVARPIFNGMQVGEKNMLGDYASTNYHEFWAVSVEVFFENPVRMRHELPTLYEAMSSLLKQDPVYLTSLRTCSGTSILTDTSLSARFSLGRI
jgi:Mlc titration factor MtfA (ptsG expression regulator)